MEDSLDYRGKPRSQFQTEFPNPSLTVNSDREMADIHTILRRHGQTGILTQLELTEEHFPDVSEIGDYASVMRIAKEAEMQFMKLPSKVREIFKHDVSLWLDTAHSAEKRASLLAQNPEGSKPEPGNDDSPINGAGNAPEGVSDPPTSKGASS